MDKQVFVVVMLIWLSKLIVTNLTVIQNISIWLQIKIVYGYKIYQKAQLATLINVLILFFQFIQVNIYASFTLKFFFIYVVFMALYQISHLSSRNDAIFMVVFYSSPRKPIVEWNFSLNPLRLYLHRHFYTICCNVDVINAALTCVLSQ